MSKQEVYLQVGLVMRITFGGYYYGTVVSFWEKDRWLAAFAVGMSGYSQYRFGIVPEPYASNPLAFIRLARQLKRYYGVELVFRRHCAANEVYPSDIKK
jgi:hypothetical protein